MAKPKLTRDFKEFLKLLNAHGVEYLLVGGYAVGYHGYTRTTLDIDFWVAMSSENARRLVRVLQRFGFSDPSISPDLFLQSDKLIRMGLPPVRIEIMTHIDGVDFAECYRERVRATLDGESVDVISLRHLRMNKRASGRHKDLEDLERLPNAPEKHELP